MCQRTFVRQRAAYLPSEYNVVPDENPAEDSSRASSPALSELPAGKKKNSKNRKTHYIQYEKWLTKLYRKYSDDNNGYTV